LTLRKSCIIQQVNAAAAARLLSKKGGAALPASAADSDEEEAEAAVPEADGTPAAKRQRTAAANPLTDDRFASMFRDRDFEIDMESEEYKLLHPNAGVAGMLEL
jgi:ribosome biogenesis protein ENP2